LRAAVDDPVSHWAYMVMTALAWSPTAWIAPSVPEHPRHRAAHREQERGLLRMEFKRFVATIIPMPCQIGRGGHRLGYRRLSWNEWQGVFHQVVAGLRCGHGGHLKRDPHAPVHRNISGREAEPGDE
jgi:hypothetical protein